jgi:hypothetical protein
MKIERYKDWQVYYTTAFEWERVIALGSSRKSQSWADNKAVADYYKKHWVVITLRNTSPRTKKQYWRYI